MTRIEEIRARNEARTQGEWTIARDECHFGSLTEIRGNLTESNGVVAQANMARDAEFIAHAPADIDYLLNRVKALEDDGERLYKLLAIQQGMCCEEDYYIIEEAFNAHNALKGNDE